MPLPTWSVASGFLLPADAVALIVTAQQAKTP
jgi:hypothetical protein